jgi:hypothetical protein
VAFPLFPQHLPCCVAPLVDLLEKNLAYPLSKGKTAKFNRKLHGFLTRITAQ